MPNDKAPRQLLAPAKINLGLHVLRRRSDGYHDIETVMVAIEWCDVLSFEHGDGGFVMTCSDTSLPTDEGNLCVRAARLFGGEVGEKISGRLHLEKVIPHGAGLGGGSSDAAAMLRLLHSEWSSANLTDEILHKLASRLGSDVPFFLESGPRFAKSRGEVLSRIGHQPYVLPFEIAVIMPPAAVNTAEAYALVAPTEGNRPDLRDLVSSNDLDQWRESLINDFQEPVFRRYPRIAAEWRRLMEMGAEYASLTGSGAAVYGLFAKPENARRAAETAIDHGCRAWSGRAYGRRS